MNANWSELVGLADGRVFVITQVDERDGWAASAQPLGQHQLTRLTGEDRSVLDAYARYRSEVRRLAEELGLGRLEMEQVAVPCSESAD